MLRALLIVVRSVSESELMVSMTRGVIIIEVPMVFIIF